MTNNVKAFIIVSFLLIYGIAVWKVHDWYDAKKELQVVNNTLDNRVKIEQQSNVQAQKGLAIQQKDKQVAEDTNKAQEKEIVTHKTVYDCVIPIDGVRIRNKAATASSR